MKVCICSLSDRPLLYEKTYPIINEYCCKWKHQFVPHYELLDNNRHPSWSKMILCKKLLQTNLYDYVVWIDDDIVLTNMDKNIVDIIKQTNDKPITIQKERELKNNKGKRVNCGFMIMKNDPKTIEILDDVWEIGETSEYKTKCPWEQGVFKSYVFTHREHFHLFNNKELQSFHKDVGAKEEDYVRWVKGDFSCHLAGISIQKRISLINSFTEN